MGDKIRIKEDAFDGDNYEPTDSDEYYSEEEQELLKKVREGRKHNVDPTKELMAFDESDDDDDEDEEDDDVGALMHNSDIEGAEETDDDLPDAMDWGSKARNYYNTDFVDPDYSTYNAEEEAMALEEEEEAKRIQQRLLKQMKERDFFPEFVDVKKAKEKNVDEKQAAETIVIKADLAGMSANDKLLLFQQDSPEFLRLASDFEVHMKEVDTLIAPVMQYVREHSVPLIPALQFAKLYQDISLTYCNNIAFYLLLKAKRISIKTHPVIQRLLQLKKLLQQLQDKYDNIIHPQLEALLERIVDGDQFKVLDVVERKAEKAKKKKSKLSILDQFEAKGKIDVADDNDVATSGATASSNDSDEDDEMDAETKIADQADENARRGITYQIAKNKGLTPHSKKELRNPRVKHRSKFRKALIRRKGAVRTVRKETKRYGGEMSGIKATVSKSIKFKV